MVANRNTMKIEVVDSEKQIFAGDVEYLVAPGSEGEIGVFPNHVPLICKLKPGVLRLQMPDQADQLIFAISGGFLEVQKNQVIVLADIAQRTTELDEERLIEQKTKALAKVKQTPASATADVAKAQAALELAIAELKAIDYIKKHKNKA
ncbi:MAG: F-type H+-transporting ATPase subunit epsilon [Pseudomonadota bacterium]|nr:F-type H+-transporting ATPase subunit epsilon [Pseudomonadota bacterium]